MAGGGAGRRVRVSPCLVGGALELMGMVGGGGR